MMRKGNMGSQHVTMISISMATHKDGCCQHSSRAAVKWVAASIVVVVRQPNIIIKSSGFVHFVKACGLCLTNQLLC